MYYLCHVVEKRVRCSRVGWINPPGSSQRGNVQQGLPKNAGSTSWGIARPPSWCEERGYVYAGKYSVDLFMSKQSIHCVQNKLHSMVRMSKQSIHYLNSVHLILASRSGCRQGVVRIGTGSRLGCDK